VGGDQDDPVEARLNERRDEVGDDRVKGLVADGERPGEGKVVAGAAHAHGGREERIEAFGELAGEVVTDDGVGGERHVVAVLLRCTEGNDDDVAARLDLGLHLRPGEPIELYRGYLINLVTKRCVAPSHLRSPESNTLTVTVPPLTKPR